jgi:hypothetical protein
MLDKLAAEMNERHKKALEHVQLAMAVLPIEHVVNQYLCIAEAFLQREIFGAELNNQRAPASEED